MTRCKARRKFTKRRKGMKLAGEVRCGKQYESHLLGSARKHEGTIGGERVRWPI